MASPLSKFFSVILPKRRGSGKSTSYTSSFNPTQTSNVLGLPAYRDHLTDIFSSRGSDDNRVLMKRLFVQDPDVSSAVNAYLTVANTPIQWRVYNLEGEIDREGHKILNDLLAYLTQRVDYSKGFVLKPSLDSICDDLRYMLLLRGGIGAELVLDKNQMPQEIRNVDLSSIEWFEPSPGQYVPQQSPESSSDKIDLNIPTFFVSFYRRDPTSIYTSSPFVSVINTVAARQQIVNDLYRIMQITGYPRMDIKVVEDVITRNAPAKIKTDPAALKTWIKERVEEVRTTVSSLRPDQAFVHTDAIETGVMNETAPGMALDIKPIIETLNAQNQAALKTMATIIGRGTMGVNTASVEARIFSLNADELNKPIAEILSQIFTLALRLQGYEGRVECRFKPAEMRSELELEPQMVTKQARHLTLLSLGLVTDDEFHMEMFGRPRPDAVPELSGTNFETAGAAVDTESISPNSDPLGRSVSSRGAKSARSNAVQK